MPKQLVWKNLVGQNRVKDILSVAFKNNTLGHAYLFCGSAGVGKFQAALELTLALHCLNESEVPCYKCESCRQILNFSHPDFHCVFPLFLEPKHKNTGDSSKLSEKGWEFITSETKKRLANPYNIYGSRLLHIPVEWIRELNHSVSRGTIKGKTNVAIICDVDIMQAASANAMLKTLEEPPPDSLILLLTKRPHAVLPTIRSRCQIIRFGWISPGAMAHSLCKEYSLDSDTPDIKHAVACADGSYSKAKLLIEESLDIFAGQANALWQLCLKESSFNNNVITALEILVEDYLGIGKDYAACEKLLIAFLHIIRSTFFRSIGDTENYINKLSTHEISNSGLCAESIEKLFAECEKAISAIRARGNILLVLTTFIMSVMEIIHGEKYEIS